MNFFYSLIEWLPFSWAQPGGMYFMKNALLAVFIIAPLFGILSTMVVTSRMSFFSDALGHSAFTGIAVGIACGLLDPLPVAVVGSIAFALLFSLAASRSDFSSDTIIGVFSATAVALGIFISTLNGGSFAKFNALLIGDILSITPSQLLLLFLVLLGVLLLWFFSFNHMMLSSVHPALANSRGIHVFWQRAFFSVAIAVVVTISMTWIGLMVINSFLVLPAAAARNVSRNVRQYHLFSLLFAVAAGLAGLFTSYYLGSSTGAVITLYLALFFVGGFALRRLRQS
ncbi:MAG: metal ABC transporter permease [Oscillospiraceae bacterium]|jgi:zinc transport system permease protein